MSEKEGSSLARIVCSKDRKHPSSSNVIKNVSIYITWDCNIKKSFISLKAFFQPERERQFLNVMTGGGWQVLESKEDAEKGNDSAMKVDDSQTSNIFNILLPVS